MGGGFVLIVARHDGRAGDGEFAVLIGGAGLTVIVEDGDGGEEEGAADTAWFA